MHHIMLNRKRAFFLSSNMLYRFLYYSSPFFAGKYFQIMRYAVFFLTGEATSHYTHTAHMNLHFQVLFSRFPASMFSTPRSRFCVWYTELEVAYEYHSVFGWLGSDNIKSTLLLYCEILKSQFSYLTHCHALFFIIINQTCNEHKVTYCSMRKKLFC